ncbi:Serine/threonine-protein kinase A-Raf [Nymphaea thermarum]|nr:Serine/threonine-protein kinase A-Raf [Nymphaea thermarum]
MSDSQAVEEVFAKVEVHAQCIVVCASNNTGVSVLCGYRKIYRWFIPPLEVYGGEHLGIPVVNTTVRGGEIITVKRLSTYSSQGAAVFKNEVQQLAKLQHKNLVRLLGCRLQGEEKILIYESVHNTSVDEFLFGNSARSEKLDSATQFKIIIGIAKGLMCLHGDSWLKVIHRDLKASNILLDQDINPKISDF